MDLLEHPRYKEAPVLLFFENYILDVLGKLPHEKQNTLQEIDLQRVFGTRATAWKDVVREVLQLSSTIDLAILDEWYKAIEAAEQQAGDIDAHRFCQAFVDAYFAENSTLDVWDEASLLKARERVHRHQMAEKLTE